MVEWGGSAVLVDSGLRREVFFLFSQGEDLFASLYRQVGGTGPGLLVCPSWGFEMAHTLDLCHELARSAARAGGAGMVLHWPGHGDSDGDIRTADVWRLAAAATDALTEGRSRSGVARWGLAGVRVGAAAAWLVARAVPVDHLVLIQPALNPAAFLRDLQQRAWGAGLDRGRQGWAFGEQLPDPASWPDLSLAEPNERVPGKGACIRFADDPPVGVPSGLDQVVVQGSWRRGLLSEYRELLQPATSWLRSAVHRDA
jgi:hypothetical protein